MMDKKIDLWQVIVSLCQQIPFSREKIEAILMTRLNEVERDKCLVIYEGKKVELTDGTRIDEIDLRLKPNDNEFPGFLVIRIEGKCITLNQVRERYGYLEITGHPTGVSLRGSTTWSSMESWGRLSFGFNESNRECLAKVIFAPNAIRCNNFSGARER